MHVRATLAADIARPSHLDREKRLPWNRQTPRNQCPLVLACTLLVDASMIEDPRKPEASNGRPNGHSTVRMVRQVKHADDQLVALVSHNPLAALGVALAFGYVLGRVMTRHG